MTSPDGLPSDFVINSRKITEYRLNLNHESGGLKARFFLSFGFRADDLGTLGFALLGQAVPENYVETVHGPRGDERFIYEAAITSPDGRNPSIRTVWLKQAALSPGSLPPFR